ncbi:PREDICTED: DENN domain-containing protein 1B isoform X2 [Thamnophis sirtalis]|uniref:DENN domain-containing protein 1B isoform X2 n=1 Tax=Thamnophis sirtalis TaxID=35019 RepID=A0A6I9XBJ3_9SAUR|nr:PREDICTED: DENN domain-containing protein 1B isoform X2 [Thamnophis sirtalis]
MQLIFSPFSSFLQAKNHAKQGMKEVKSKLKHKTRFGDVPTNRPHNDSALEEDADDELDPGSKLSSEDSEETSYYLYDSDDSGELAKTSVPPGEMDLLGEILDTLSTHSSDQGKLSGAKSLDFFRSMDDIDYKSKNKSNTPSESNLALLCSGWNQRQDDSHLTEKKLPQSPRKPAPSGGVRESVFVLNKEHPNLTSSADDLTSPNNHPRSPDSPQEAMQGHSVQTLQLKSKWNETLSRTSPDENSPSLSPNPSFLVPWEREAQDGNGILEEGGLLEEVVSLCKLTSAFSQGLNISGDGFSNSSGNQT